MPRACDGGPARPRRGWWGIDLFIEDGAYTTVASAVSMLMVLALLFSASLAVWGTARSGDVQVSADAAALSGANVVASYHTAATVMDASVLSLGLAGFAMTGAGMAGAFVPGAQEVAAKALDMGIELIAKRNELAVSASRGLQKLEASLPYLIAANATRTCSAHNTEKMRYAGSALAAPATSASNFPALAGEQIDVEDLEDSSSDLEEAADELKRASEEAEQKKEAAWLADCGRDGMNMQERAGRLSGISPQENPDYESSLTWEPRVAIDRARAYYRWRYDHDRPDGSGVEARADAAARHAFYGYALKKFERADYSEDGDTVRCTVELLPRNTNEVRRTELYTDSIWPSSYEEQGLTLHYGGSCPGFRGASGPLLALSATEGGGARECPVCHFGVGDVGKTPAASTSIDNGFEYHLREYTLALKAYVPARQRELDARAMAMERADDAGTAFEDAISALSGKRPRIAPPGRDGCVAFVVASKAAAPDELSTPFARDAPVAERGALAAAALAPDKATTSGNVLSGFFGALERRVGGGGAVGLIGAVMDLWGRLLVSYGTMADGVEAVFADLIQKAERLGADEIGKWLARRLHGIVRALGIEPVDLRQRKPVLTDSAFVARRAGMEQLEHAQAVIRGIPAGSADPEAIVKALGYELGEHLTSIEFTLAEIPLPGGGSLPVVIRLRDLIGLAGGAR